MEKELSEATSINERIEKCLKFLLPLELDDGRPVLSVFLFALRDNYKKGDALTIPKLVLLQKFRQLIFLARLNYEVNSYGRNNNILFL